VVNAGFRCTGAHRTDGGGSKPVWKYAQYRVLRLVTALCYRTASRRVRVPRPLSIRSPYLAWSRRCIAKDTRTGPHCRRFQCRTDAEPGLPHGRNSVGKHRPHPSAGWSPPAAWRRHVSDSSTPTFQRDLVGAFKETRATLAFDAIGGGTWRAPSLQPWRRHSVPSQRASVVTVRRSTSRCTSTAY